MDNEDRADDRRRLAARATQIEELITHQQQTIHDLNDAILLQEKRISALETRLEHMATQMVSLSETVSDNTDEEPPPPHY